MTEVQCLLTGNGSSERVSPTLKRVTLSSRIGDIAIWQAAAYELKRSGDDAIGVAVRRAERLSCLGDTEGSLAWTRISRAIEVLRREPPAHSP